MRNVDLFMDMSQQKVKWRVFEDADRVAEYVAQQMLAAAARAIARRGEFKCVLAGGRSPLAAYRQLLNSDADWRYWKIYFGDERCAPADDPQRNSKAAAEAWLAQSPIAPENVFYIQAEQGAERAAAAYGKRVQEAMPFDLVLLGMGEDGHTASLFPGHAEPEHELALAVHDAPKPPPDRVSLSSLALSSSSRVLIIVTGAGKHAAVRRWRAGEDLPVSRIGALESVQVVLDRDAAGEAFQGEDVL